MADAATRPTDDAGHERLAPDLDGRAAGLSTVGKRARTDPHR